MVVQVKKLAPQIQGYKKEKTIDCLLSGFSYFCAHKLLVS
jgi:hypothetical protein